MKLEGLRIVILTHGSGGSWGPLLETLEREEVELSQIVVVHNPTDPDEARPVLPDGCELIAADRNRGYSVGMNLGIRRQLERDPEFVLVLTHDARFDPGALRRMVEAARAHPDYGVLGPALVLEDGTPFSYGGYITPSGILFHLDQRPSAETIHDCDWVDGGTMLFRADLLRRIGGFEERFFIYCEDSEICWRVTQTGAKAGVVVDARAEQAPGGAKRLGPWSYLTTRNGTFVAARVRGRRGQVGATWRFARAMGLAFIRTTVRAVGLRPGDPKETWALTVGTARGLLDYRRGVWGPPPNLPGSGDVKNVG